MANNLLTFQQFREKDQPLYGQINPMTDVEGGISNLAQERELATSLLQQVPQEQSQQVQFDQTISSDQEAMPSAQLSEGVIPRVTQKFGNRSSIEAFSGGVNLGTDFGVKRGTPLGLPPGEWKVVDAFAGAVEGNRGANSGSGNLVKVVNTKTGETLAFEHLDRVGVKPGQTLPGGTVIGTSGNTGNSTGPHASIPYKNAQGQYQDVLNTPYAKYIFGQGAGGGNGMGGGFLDWLGKTKEKVLTMAEPVEGQPIRNILRSQLPNRVEVQQNSELLNKLGTTGFDSFTPEEKSRFAEANMVYPIGAIQSTKLVPKGLTRSVHPDDVKLINEVANVLGAGKAIRNTPAWNNAQKTIQVLAETYLPKDKIYGTTQSILTKLLKATQ